MSVQGWDSGPLPRLEQTALLVLLETRSLSLSVLQVALKFPLQPRLTLTPDSPASASRVTDRSVPPRCWGQSPGHAGRGFSHRITTWLEESCLWTLGASLESQQKHTHTGNNYQVLEVGKMRVGVWGRVPPAPRAQEGRNVPERRNCSPNSESRRPPPHVPGWTQAQRPPDKRPTPSREDWYLLVCSGVAAAQPSGAWRPQSSQRQSWVLTLLVT